LIRRGKALGIVCPKARDMTAPKKGFLAFEAKAVSHSICTNPSPEKYNGEFRHLGIQGS
jgi:hypothetical protein